MKIFLCLLLIVVVGYAAEPEEKKTTTKDGKSKRHLDDTFYNNYDFSNFGNLENGNLYKPSVFQFGYKTGNGLGSDYTSGSSLGFNSGAYLRSGIINSRTSQGTAYPTGISRQSTGIRFGSGYNTIESIAPQVSKVQSHEIHTVTQQLAVPVPQPYPVQVTKTVQVPRPYPVVVPKIVPVAYKVKVPVEVPKPYPVKVSEPVPVPYKVKVPVEVPRPYPVPVTKTVQVPVEKPVYVKVPQAVPVPVKEPYPVPIKVPTPVVVKVPEAIDVRSISQIDNGFNAGNGYFANDQSSTLGSSYGGIVSGVGSTSGTGFLSGSQLDSGSFSNYDLNSGKTISSTLTGSYVPSVYGGLSGYNAHNTRWKYL